MPFLPLLATPSPVRLNKIPFKIWFFVFSLVFFGISLYRLPGVVAGDMSTDPELIERYLPEVASLRKTIINYHKDMNKLFNDSIEKLLSGKWNVKPPEDGNCDETNVSTYCVALVALDYYDAFRQAMIDDPASHLKLYVDQVEDDMSDAEKISFFNNEDRSAYRIDKLMDNQAQREALIYDQIDIAQKAMDTTLAAYNELFLFYNLHLHYLMLITDLEAYRDKLAKLRTQVEQYPSAFHNRMTTDCK